MLLSNHCPPPSFPGGGKPQPPEGRSHPGPRPPGGTFLFPGEKLSRRNSAAPAFRSPKPLEPPGSRFGATLGFGGFSARLRPLGIQGGPQAGPTPPAGATRRASPAPLFGATPALSPAPRAPRQPGARPPRKFSRPSPGGEPPLGAAPSGAPSPGALRERRPGTAPPGWGPRVPQSHSRPQCGAAPGRRLPAPFEGPPPAAGEVLVPLMGGARLSSGGRGPASSTPWGSPRDLSRASLKGLVGPPPKFSPGPLAAGKAPPSPTDFPTPWCWGRLRGSGRGQKGRQKRPARVAPGGDVLRPGTPRGGPRGRARGICCPKGRPRGSDAGPGNAPVPAPGNASAFALLGRGPSPAAGRGGALPVSRQGGPPAPASGRSAGFPRGRGPRVSLGPGLNGGEGRGWKQKKETNERWVGLEE